MKIDMLSMVKMATPIAETQDSNQTNFQMILGSQLQSKQSLEASNQQLQDQMPIMQLIASLLNNSDIQNDELIANDEMKSDLNQLLDDMFPEWKETVAKLLDILPVQKDLSDLTLREDDVEYDFLSATLYLFQRISELPLNEINALPANDIMFLVKASKELPSLIPYSDISLQQMKKIENLGNALQELLSSLQEQLKETKRQSITNALEMAFSKTKEHNEPALLPNKAVLFPNISRHLTINREQQLTGNPDVTTNSKGSQELPTVQQFIPTESFVLQVNEPISDEVAIRSFVREFSNILARSSFTQGINSSKLLIKLYPEKLGTLRVELMQKDGQLIARIMTATNKAKELLDSQLHQLRSAFSQQNIAVDKIEVTMSHNETPKYTNQDDQGNRENHKEKDQEHKQTTSGDFKEALSDVLFETEV